MQCDVRVIGKINNLWTYVIVFDCFMMDCVDTDALNKYDEWLFNKIWICIEIIIK